MKNNRDMANDAPDLGTAFHPSPQVLKLLAQEKAKVIQDCLNDNSYELKTPTTKGLVPYLEKRMKEQGRFAGLCVDKGTDVCFMKFPLGGKSAREMARREFAIYSFINSHNHTLPITKTQKLIDTPYGFALVIDYFGVKRLENVDKSDKIETVADILYKLQTLPVQLPTKPILLGNGTTPIHTFEKYYTSVSDRIKLCLEGNPPRFSRDTTKKILKKIEIIQPLILRYENTPVFSHRDFFDKNIVVRDPIVATLLQDDNDNSPSHSGAKHIEAIESESLYLVDFEHSAIVKNYILGLNFDLANICVQWYRYPHLTAKLIKLVRAKHDDKKLFDVSLTACFIIHVLAKIDYTAQKMTPGGVEENIQLLESLL